MPTPITWRNVQINSGADSASLGTAAAGFGRNAIQGLDIFSDQMQERVTQEDERLTNEAIATALRGGPQVSGNRRVDADALQLAVERNLQGKRLGEEHVLAQETGRLENIGQGFENQQDEFIVANQEESLRLQRLLDKANLEDKQQQTKESKIRVEDLQRQVADAARITRATKAHNEFMYGGGRDAEIDADFERDWEASPGDPAQKESFRAQYREDTITQSLGDVDYGPQMARKSGFNTVNEWVANTDDGAQWAAGRAANIAADVEDARLAAKDKKVFNDGLTNYLAGNKTSILHDPNSPDGISFGKGQSNITADDQKVVLSDLDINPDKDKSENFMAKLNSEFKDPGMFRYVAETIIGDSGEIPDNYESLIDGWAFTAAERAKQLQNPTTFSSGGTPSENLRNAVSAAASGKAVTPTTGDGKRKVTEGYELPKATNPTQAVKAIQDVMDNTAVTLDNLTPATVQEADDWIYLAQQMNAKIADPSLGYKSKKAASTRLQKAMDAIERIEKKNRKRVESQSLDAAINRQLQQ